MNAKPNHPSQTPAAAYETTDLYLGAFLKAHGLSLLDRRLDGRRVPFVFEIDTTAAMPEGTARAILDVLRGTTEGHKPGDIDWSHEVLSWY